MDGGVYTYTARTLLIFEVWPFTYQDYLSSPCFIHEISYYHHLPLETLISSLKTDCRQTECIYLYSASHRKSSDMSPSKTFTNLEYHPRMSKTVTTDTTQREIFHKTGGLRTGTCDAFSISREAVLSISTIAPRSFWFVPYWR